MLTWILSDSLALAEQIRLRLTQWDHTCPAEHLFRVDELARYSPSDRSAENLLLVVLAPNPVRSLTALRQLRAQSSTPIIVVGPRDPSLILEAMRAGADDYVNDAEALDYELLAAVQRQSTQRAGKHASQGSVFAITGATGGCGRSLVAVNLAVLIAKAAGRSCLLDLDPLGGVCSSMLNVTPRHTILDLGKQPEKIDRSTFEQALVTHESGVNLLAGAGEIVPLDLFDGDFVDRLVQAARMTFPAVLLDLHNLADEVLVKRLLAHQVKLVLMTRLDFNSICGTGRVLEYWERCGISRKDVIIVANRCGQPGDVPLRKVEQALSLRIEHFLPDDPVLTNRSINNGIPFVLEPSPTALGKALATLSAVMMGATGTAPQTKMAASLSPQSRWLRLGQIISRLT